MKKKTWIFIIVAVLILLAVLILFISNFSIRYVNKINGSVHYNENNLYIPYSKYLFEISEDGMITQYNISRLGEKRSIEKATTFRLNFSVKKYISWELFIAENDDIMFGDIKGTEHKKLGKVKNVECISLGKNEKGDLIRSAVVTSDGLLYVQGDNSTGALGIEEKQVNNEFVQVPNLQNIVKAVCGINCILVLNADGEVFISGTLGELSYQTFTKLEVPEKVKDISASDTTETLLALDTSGNVYEIGVTFFTKDYYDEWTKYKDVLFYSSFHKISKLKNIVSITTFKIAACAIDKDGKVFYWGAQMTGKSTELKKVFKCVYGLPKYNSVWISGYFYVLSDDKITVYS